MKLKECSKLFRWALLPRDPRAVDAGSTQVDDDRGGLITVHELHQTIREIGQELSIDDVRFSSVV